MAQNGLGNGFRQLTSSKNILSKKKTTDFTDLNDSQL